jgi:Domain of unknown function (DUF4263)
MTDMYELIDPVRRDQLEREFGELLKSAAEDEHAVQRFMELNSELIMTPMLLNHGLHLDVVISQLPVSLSLKTDFAYLTKSSIAWRLVMVEIEQPSKSLFTNKDNWVTESAAFKDALAQVYTWQEELERNRSTLMSAIQPLLKPIQMRNNNLDFSYVLVIGRDNEIKSHQERRDRLAALAKKGILVFTYDSVLRSLKRESPKNVLALKGRKYRMKHLHTDPGALLTYLDPTELEIESSQRDQLVAWGYDMDAWDAGEPLVVNNKLPMRALEQRFDEVLEMLGRRGKAGADDSA